MSHLALSASGICASCWRRPAQRLMFLRTIQLARNNLTTETFVALMLPVLNAKLVTEAEGEAFSSRFALASLGASSLCLDLQTGNFFELNATGARICTALLDGNSVRDVEQLLSSEFGLSRAEARRDVGWAVNRLKAQYPSRERPRLQFERGADRWKMLWDGTPILDFDPHSEELFWLRSSAAADEIENWLRVALPHLLIHRGNPIVHASSVRFENELVAFCGPSGSGKSTCARIFSEDGAVLVSEDLLVVRLEAAPEAFLASEGVLRDWAAKTARMVGREAVSACLGALVDQLCGPTARLSQMIFLDQNRRGGSEIVLERLSTPDAAGALLENGFGELGDRQVWRNLLRFSSALAQQVPAFRGTAPAGIDPLRAALRRYRASFTS